MKSYIKKVSILLSTFLDVFFKSKNLYKIEKAASLKYIERPISEIKQSYLESASTVLDKIEHYENVRLKLGNIVICKETNKEKNIVFITIE